MKTISDIIDEALKVTRVADTTSTELYKSMKSDIRADKSNKVLGKGLFGTTYEKLAPSKVGRKTVKENDENVVYKVARTNHENPYSDPYLRWAKHSMDNHSSNPHLPRIHSINTYKTSTGNVHVIKMEKLTPLDKLSSAETNSMIRHSSADEHRAATIGHDSLDDAGNRPYIHMSRIRDVAIAYDHIRSNTGHLIPDQHREFGQHHMLMNRTDKLSPAMNDAIKDVVAVKHSNKHIIDPGVGSPKPILDMHAGNFMARRTPFGVHLVITDPLASLSDINSIKRGNKTAKKYIAFKRQAKKIPQTDNKS